MDPYTSYRSLWRRHHYGDEHAARSWKRRHHPLGYRLVIARSGYEYNHHTRHCRTIVVDGAQKSCRWRKIHVPCHHLHPPRVWWSHSSRIIARSHPPRVRRLEQNSSRGDFVELDASCGKSLSFKHNRAVLRFIYADNDATTDCSACRPGTHAWDQSRPQLEHTGHFSAIDT